MCDRVWENQPAVPKKTVQFSQPRKRNINPTKESLLVDNDFPLRETSSALHRNPNRAY